MISSSKRENSASSTSNDSNSNAVSNVRVGVRVRPLTASEISKGGKIVVNSKPWDQTVGIAKRMFTYDSVFDSKVSQEDLYQDISKPLLNSVLDGYNATIMAYGQTGSGKTFTMGSESLQSYSQSLQENQGLIPRFMADIFCALGNIQSKEKQTTDDILNVSVSFLEVYGEEIHDLLDENQKSLPIREDSNGEVSVVGLRTVQISNANEAINILHQGTLHRTTAATLMNHSSSRSHAVFSIYLEKRERNKDSNDFAVTSCSRFTFVDLAGSERMKRTGAEGERAKEGIKINEGLLALGNVINALADEERLIKGEKVHVPYRQSKLTRLLQDALGGNSQTLFLACVSPSDTNANETLSTLQYANRARNIKNKPVKNIDPTLAELRRLHSLTNLLQSELLKEKFGIEANPQSSLSDFYTDLSQRGLFVEENIQEYMEQLHIKASAEHDGKSFDYSHIFSKPQTSKKEAVYPNVHSSIPTSVTKTQLTPTYVQTTSRNKTKLLLHPSDDVETEFLDIDPDKDMAILDQLLELQHHDQEFDEKQKKDQEELCRVDGELAAQEDLLNQLRENLKQYHSMKEKYEILMNEVQSLEAEKVSLATELENVQVDPTKGCSKAIKSKLEKVEKSLARARSETRKHQSMYRKAEMEAQKCKVLERKISDLKQGKVAFLKKQRESAAKHREFTEQKRKEIQQLKKKERKNDIKLTKLQGECKQHKLNLDKRKKYCLKLSEKLKQTESHLMRVLDMRRKKLNDRTKDGKSKRILEKNSNNVGISSDTDPINNKSFAPKTEEIDSIKFLLEKMIDDKVKNSLLETTYEHKVTSYSELMRSLVKEVKLLNEAKEVQSTLAVNQEDTSSIDKNILDREENIDDLELKIDLISTELEDFRFKFPILIGNCNKKDIQPMQKSENAAMRMVSNLSAPVTRTILWDLLDKLRAAMLKNVNLEESVERKDSALESCEIEIDTLNSKIKSVSKTFDRRRTLSNSVTLDARDEESARRINEIEISTLRQTLERTTKERDQAKTVEINLKEEIQRVSLELAKEKEKNSLMEATAKQTKPTAEVRLMMENLQRIWEEIGVDIKDRGAIQEEIRNCLENICEKKLNEATAMSEEIHTNLSQLRRDISTMSESLDFSENISKLDKISCRKLPLLEQIKLLESNLNEVEPTYNAAYDRREKIVSDLNLLMKSIGYTVENLSVELKKLLDEKPSSLKRKRNIYDKARKIQKGSREKRARIFKDVENMVKALEPSEKLKNDESFMNSGYESEVQMIDANNEGEEEDVITLFAPPKSLSSNFLDKCEKDMKELRLMKSNIIVAYSQIRDQGHDLSKSMNLSSKEVLSIVIHSLKKGKKEFPTWWQAKIAENVCNAVTHPTIHVQPSESFGIHLDAINEALQVVANGRRTLAGKLKSLIEEAHKTLLSTVEGAMDANDATALFKDALFKLPPLSKDCIQACIDEINVLTKASEGMSQSELEALTFVWKASDITQSERGEFWSEVDEATREIETKAESPFDSILQSCQSDSEEWLLSSVQSAMKAYRRLNVRLFKLSKIHDEVEKLRAKQDAKSKITSLDAEIRIISARLIEFEEKASNKGRLLTKKVNSTNFLKEERFRKHMQGKFASKLKSFGLLLQEWKRTEGSNFDSKILSEDMQALLKSSDGEDILAWVEQRTAFMHLKMVKSKTAKKKFTENRKAQIERNNTSLPHPPRSATRTRSSPSPSLRRNRAIWNEKPIASPAREKKLNSRESSYKIGTPPRKERRLTHRESPYRARTSPHSGDRIPRVNSSPNHTKNNHLSKSTSRERPKNSTLVSSGTVRRNLTPKKKSSTKNTINTTGSTRTSNKGIFHRHTNYSDSPRRKRTPQKMRRDSQAGKRASILPFGDILATTPTSKENTAPK